MLTPQAPWPGRLEPQDWDAIAPHETVKTTTRKGNKPLQAKKAETRTNRYHLVKSKFRLEPLRTANLWEKFLVTRNLHA